MAQAFSNPFTIQIVAKPVAGLPAWVPPAGYFADVPMQNNAQDVTPALYRTSPSDTAAMSNPFNVWGGSAVLRDYSPLGAQVYYSGGHEPSREVPNVQFSLICDFSTLRWSVANLPAAPNLASAFVNGLAPDGTPYTPHTYLGLQEFPRAWGGGTRGSLASFFWAGSPFENRINLLDVSKTQNGYSQLATRQAQNADPNRIRLSATSNSTGSYPITVMDNARQGWWVTAVGPTDYTLFVSKTGAITQHPAVGGNLANGALVLCNSLNLLVAVDGGYSQGPNAGTRFRNLYIRNLANGATTQVTTQGNVPSLQEGYDGNGINFHRPDALGLQWVDELGCIVGLDQSANPPVVVKLKPPATNPASSPWTWSTMPLQHWPSDSGGQATLQSAVNNIWSKFRWVPSLQAFVYCSAKDRKPQVLKLS
ncbi:hypothetical protein MJ904_08160 [Massilia sp. MB5]|uniref:hypothetical protein n=1 Tax=Massilia sp. MB5 TaxID=2919578 RepID=UPI001F11390F|nr:hypothetical protein [Massilia sp. MB5]UMR32134.1 hypothetical protein MJ904_08160 [Massilia sp. MB5]